MSQRNAIAPFLALAALAAGSGCHHLTTKVPGVLDMRTDGSGAAPAPKKAGGERTGIEGIFWGEGVQGTTELKVTDRKYWLCAILPVLNESATEEITVALGPNGALRNCRIGEQSTFTDWLIGTGIRCIPILNSGSIIMPPHDFFFYGTPVAGASAAVPRPTTDAPPPPPPEEAAPAPVPDAAAAPAAPTGT